MRAPERARDQSEDGGARTEGNRDELAMDRGTIGDGPLADGGQRHTGSWIKATKIDNAIQTLQKSDLTPFRVQFNAPPVSKQ